LKQLNKKVFEHISYWEPTGFAHLNLTLVSGSEELFEFSLGLDSIGTASSKVDLLVGIFLELLFD